MKRLPLLTFAFILLLLLTTPTVNCKAKEVKVSTSKSRAVSLKVLQDRLRDCQQKESCSKELLQIAGLKKITGYVMDETYHDLVLFGNVDESMHPLYLEDFVIALRNAWFKFAPLKGNTYYYSDPGCSIDPDPKVMKKLQAIGQQIFSTSSPKKVEKKFKDWHRTCRSPQVVRVLGIPFNSRFGWVMVTADYDMKRLVDGSDALNIPGFISLTDMKMDMAKRDLKKGIPLAMSLSMNRFWFYPGENRYTEDEGIIIIKNCPVILLTEEEYLSKTGEISGRGRANPFAQRFTESFTDNYAKIARQRPIYTELENLFRFVALAKIIQFKSSHSEVGLNLDYFLDQYQISKTPVDKHLPGRSNIKDFKHRQDYQGGYSIQYLWLPSCGGVGIEIQAKQQNFEKDTTQELAKMREEALKARSSPDALFWDVPPN